MLTIDSTKLVNAEQLLQQLWDESSRPSLRWLKEQQRRRVIPHIRIGSRSVFFDPQQVRAALAQRFTVQARGAQQ